LAKATSALPTNTSVASFLTTKADLEALALNAAQPVELCVIKTANNNLKPSN
jgi:hypothetical protein